MSLGIWNLTNDCGPESNFHHQRLEFSAWNPETMEWNLNPIQSWISLHLSGVRVRITREIFFGTLTAGDITLLVIEYLFFSLRSTLFLQLHHEVSGQFDATCRCVDCMCSP